VPAMKSCKHFCSRVAKGVCALDHGPVAAQRQAWPAYVHVRPLNGSDLRSHIAAETLGLLLEVVVTAASVQDRHVARPLLWNLHRASRRIGLIWANVGYAGKLAKAVAKITDDKEPLLAFYDFPAEHWIHVKTTNERVSKGSGRPPGRSVGAARRFPAGPGGVRTAGCRPCRSPRPHPRGQQTTDRRRRRSRRAAPASS
jgi:hypothetical protein